MEIKVVHNLYEDIDFSLIWKGNEYYPADKISIEKEKNYLKGSKGIKITIPGALQERDKYDDVFNTVYNILYKLIFNLQMPSFLVFIERDIKKINKIRSYKGVLPKKELIVSDYFETEISFDKDSSLIGGIIKISSSNFNAIIKMIGDNRNSFVVSLPSDVLPQSFIELIIKDYRYDQFNYTIIQYPKLIYHISNIGGIIYRIGGDGGDTNLSLEIFKKDETDDFMNLVG